MDSPLLRKNVAAIGPQPTAPSPSRLARSLGLLAGFIVTYLALDRISFIHPMQQFNITPWVQRVPRMISTAIASAA